MNYADIDGDGKKDLVTGRRFFAHGFKAGREGDPAELYWFGIRRSKGQAPVLVPHRIDDQSGIGIQFVTDDLDGDGRMDIVVSGRKGVFIFLNQ
jgi:hypothetical protein